MTGHCTEDLQEFRDLLETNVRQIKRSIEMKPIRDLVLGNMQDTISFTARMGLDAEIEAARGALDLERTLAKDTQMQHEHESLLSAEFARIRRRTAALRVWLEAL